MKKKNTTSFLIFSAICSVLAAYVANRIAAIALSLPGNVILNINTALQNVCTDIQKNPFYISKDQNALIVAGVACFAVWLAVLYRLSCDGNYMPGIEHGSAAWGTAKDSKYFKDKTFSENIILTQTEFVSLHPKFIKIGLDTYDPNHNVVIVGGSGSGKTRRYLIPNAMQMHSSYVFTDPKGTLLYQVGSMFQKNGYTIRVLNLVDLEKSDHYNPFHYLKNDMDILHLVDNLMDNTESPNSSKGDSFWIDQTRGLYCALFAYLLYETCPEDRTMKNVLKLLLLAEVHEGDDEYKTPLDVLFEDVEKEKPDCFAVIQYKKFKQSKGRTAASILATANSKLDKFYVDSVSELTSTDDLDFSHIGDDPEHPVALFVILSDTNSSLNFLAAMMFQQLFDTLIWRADNVYGASLPCPVRFMLDEFKNIGKIPDFDRKLATIRSRNISADIIVQSLSQLKEMYKESWESIIGCCDSLLYLGSIETFTNEYVSKMIGKTTVDNKNVSISKGSHGSYSLADQIIGRELITSDELARLHSEECVLILAHKKPFRSLKYDPKKHPNYSQTSLADKKNTFHLEQRVLATSRMIDLDDIPETTDDNLLQVDELNLSAEEANEFNSLFEE